MGKINGIFSSVNRRKKRVCSGPGHGTLYKDDKRMCGLGPGFMELAAYTELGAHCVPLAHLRGMRPRRVPAQPERAPPCFTSAAQFSNGCVPCCVCCLPPPWVRLKQILKQQPLTERPSRGRVYEKYRFWPCVHIYSEHTFPCCGHFCTIDLPLQNCYNICICKDTPCRGCVRQ